MLHNIIYGKLMRINRNVFPGVAPDKTALPYIVFFPVSNQPSPDGSGKSLLDHIRVQISCFGRSYRETEIMANKVRYALDELVEESYGMKIQRVVFSNDVYIQEGTGVHHRAVDYMVYVTPRPEFLSNVKYGRMYNYPTVASPLFAPANYHVPTDADWIALETYLIANGYNYDDTTTGNKIAKALAANSGWDVSATTGAVGNTDYPAKRNVTGFLALPGGYRDSNGYFGDVGNFGPWWSATENGTNNAWYRYLNFGRVDVSKNHIDKEHGFSVRLIRDNLTGYIEGEPVTDLDGNVYDTVQIGNQVWLQQNWACTKLRSGNAIANVTDNAAWAALTTGAYCNYDNNEANVFKT